MASLAMAAVALFATADGSTAQTRPAGQKRSARAADKQDARQKGPVKWWHAYRSELGLTADQVSRIGEIFESTFPQMVTRYDELKKREDQLSTLISANDATEAQVLRQADQIEAMRGELSKTRVLMLFRMRRVLSPEQREKLVVLQREREGVPQPSRR